MAELDNLQIRISASATSAEKAINKLTASLRNLGVAMDGVGTLGSFNASMTKTAVVVPKASKALNLWSRSAKQAQKSTFNLAATIGKFYATYWAFMRAARWVGSSMTLASDLVEVQNVVDNTFGDMKDKMEDFAKTSVDTLGMSELTAKEIATRFQAMGVNMGIPKSAIESTNEFLQATTKMRDGSGRAYADVSHSVADMSLNLTKLAGDMASFYNKDYKEVAQALESIYTGQARPLRRFGVDLTEASLKEFALANGMDANIKKMSQYEKVLLRYEYVLSHTNAAHGDFQRTIGTWANQMKIAHERMIKLKSVLGTIGVNVFKPLVRYFNDAMNSIIHLAESTLNSLGKIFGWKVEIGDVGAIADETGDIADNMDDAAGAAKKMKDYTLGIDELNVFNDDDGKGGGGGGGGGANAAIEPSVKWEETEKGYESIYDTLYKLGQRIGEIEKQWLQGIKWDEIYAKAEKFGKGLASFLNGYLSDAELFWEKGRLVANTMNVIAHALKSFAEEFDGYKLGVDIGSWINGLTDNIDWITIQKAATLLAEDLAQAINGAVETTDWIRVGKTIAQGLNTAVTFLHTFLTTTNWGNIGDAIGNIINGFVRNFDAKKAAETVAAALRGAFALVNNLLKTTDFYAIGKKIGEFLAGINIFEYVDDIAKMLWNLLKAAFEVLAGMIKEAPFETALLAGFGLFKLFGVGNLIGVKLGNAILTAMGGAPITNAVATGANMVGTSFGSKFATQASSLAASKLGTFLTTDIGALASNTGLLGKAGLVGAGVGAAILAGITGYEIGTKIGKALFPDSAEYYDMSAQEVVGYIIENFKEIPEGVKEMTSVSFDETKRFFDNIGTVSQDYVIAELYKLGELEGENDEYIRHLSDLYNNTDVTWAQIKNDILAGKIEIDASGFDAIKTALEETGASATEVREAMSYLKNAQQEYYDGFDAWLNAETSYKNAIDVGAISREYAYQMYLRDKEAKEEETSVADNLTSTQDALTGSTEVLNDAISSQTTQMDSLTATTEKTGYALAGVPSYLSDVATSMSETTEVTLSAEEESQKFQELWDGYTVKDVDITQLHDINTVLQDINTTSDNLVTSFDENFGTISTGLKEKLEEAKTDITTFDEDVNEKLSTMFDETLPKDLEATSKAIDTFIKTTSDSIDTFDKDVIGKNLDTLFDDTLPTKFDTLSGNFGDLLTTNEKTLTDSLGNVEKAVGDSVDNVQKKFKGFLEWFDKNILAKTKAEYWTKALSGVSGAFETTFRGVANSIATIMNSLIDQINSSMNVKWDNLIVNGQTVLAAGQAKLFEITPIPMYERGGFPEDGLFYANHNEMVGRFSNGQTAVANNEQIVAGIQEGVSAAMSEVVFNMLNPYLSDIAQSSRETANKDFSVNLGDRDIAMAANRGQNLVGMTIIS